MRYRADWTLTVLAATLSISGCGGAERRQADTTSEGGAVIGPTAAATAPSAAPAAAAAEIALGDSIFKGQVAGGICYTCHGPDATGTQLGPNLVDSEWLNGDGSLQFIQNTVTTGVAKPKKYPGVMPPFGQTLTAQQVRAVAAYVYSQSRPGTSSRKQP